MIKTKYKEGDKVLLLSDLTQEFTVKKVWMTKEPISNHYWGIFDVEKVALDNDKIYSASELVPYNEAVQRLAMRIEKLENAKPKFWDILGIISIIALALSGIAYLISLI